MTRVRSRSNRNPCGSCYQQGHTTRECRLSARNFGRLALSLRRYKEAKAAQCRNVRELVFATTMDVSLIQVAYAYRAASYAEYREMHDAFRPKETEDIYEQDS